MNAALSRRALLSALTATAAIGPIAVPAAASIRSGDRTAWDRAFRAYEQAKAEDGAYSVIFDPLYDRCLAAVEAVPHVELRPDPYSGLHQPVSTDNFDFVHRAHRLVTDVASGKCHLETERYPSLGEHWQLCQEVAAAADERDATVAATRARFGMDEAEEKWEALGEAAYETEWAVMDIPAPDLPALRWKLEKLLRTDPDGSVSCWSAKVIAVTMADVRRLLVGEA